MDARMKYMDAIWNMRHKSIVTTLFNLRNSAILFHTLTIDPGLSEYKNVLEIARQQYYIPNVRKILDNFIMFGYSPYEIQRSRIDGVSVIYFIVPDWGTWHVVTQAGKNGTTKLVIKDNNDPEHEYRIARTALYNGPLHSKPDYIHSECGELIHLYLELEEKKAITKLLNNRYINSKPILEKQFMKDHTPNPDEQFEKEMLLEINPFGYHGSKYETEFKETETAQFIPANYTASRYQFKYEKLFDIAQEEMHFIKFASLSLNESLDHIYSSHGGGYSAYKNAAVVDKQISEKTMKIMMMIEDLVNTIKYIWNEMYNVENPNISISHGTQMDFERIFKLMEAEVLSKEQGKSIISDMMGIS